MPGESYNSVLESNICAEPNDEEAFRAYARWLEENGNPRGELGRLQLAIEAIGERRGPLSRFLFWKRRPPTHAELTARIEQLLATDDGRFRGRFSGEPIDQIGDSFGGLTWRGGFWRALTLDESITNTPILSEILEHPSARLLNALHIWGSPDDAIEALLNVSAPLGALRVLTCGSTEVSDADLALSCSRIANILEHWPQLTTLAVTRADVELPTTMGLVHLDLRMGVSHDAMQRLAASKLPNLRILDIGLMNYWDYPELNWRSDTLSQLLRGRATPNLNRLRFWPGDYAHGMALDFDLEGQIESSELAKTASIEWMHVEQHDCPELGSV